MLRNFYCVALLATACGWAQAPAGRWDGTILFGTLKVPFSIYFEGSGKTITGSFVNGDSRAASTTGSFEAGSLRLAFAPSGARMEATLADGQLTGSYGNAQQGMHALTASAFCTCGFEGEAGPEIMGTWEVPDAGWRLTIGRKGDDTLATVSRTGDELGPVTGRFDGLAFALHYFDGVRAAVLEIEPRADGGLDVVYKEPGADVKKYRAVRAGKK